MKKALALIITLTISISLAIFLLQSCAIVGLNLSPPVLGNFTHVPPAEIIITSPSGTYGIAYPIYLNVSAYYLRGNGACWMTYILDGNANVSVSGGKWSYDFLYGSIIGASVVLPVVSEGSHRIDVFTGAYGGVTHNYTVNFSVDLTPSQLTILSPQNKTYGQNPIPLNISTSEVVSYMEYRLDGVEHPIVYNKTALGGLSLKGLTDGVHSIVIYATDFFGNKDASDTVWFTVDTTKPTVAVLSPQNTTYQSTNATLTFSVSKPFTEALCSLDGNTNVSRVQNVTLPNLTYGTHNITIYASDTLGNIGASQTIYFTILQPSSSEQEKLLPTAITSAVVLSIAIVCVSTAVYLRRHRK